MNEANVNSIWDGNDVIEVEKLDIDYFSSTDLGSRADSA